MVHRKQDNITPCLYRMQLSYVRKDGSSAVCVEFLLHIIGAFVFAIFCNCNKPVWTPFQVQCLSLMTVSRVCFRRGGTTISMNLEQKLVSYSTSYRHGFSVNNMVLTRN